MNRSGFIAHRKYHSLILLISCALRFGNVRSQTCHLRELGKCTATVLLFTHNPSGIATSESELIQQCSHLRNAENCVRNYTRRCMTPSQQEMIYFATARTYKTIGDYCTPGSQKRQVFLKRSSACWGRDRPQDQRNCVEEFHEVLKNFTSTASSDDRKKAGCCAYRGFITCTKAALKSKCVKETIDFMHLILKMSLSYLPDALCQDYFAENEEQDCDRSSLPATHNQDDVSSKLFSGFT